jgi:tRNA1(Val) A37 N6-methylase TrmN6
MLSRDEFVYHHVCGHIQAGPDDSRYRLAQLTGDRRRILDAGCAVGYIGEFVKRSSPDRWIAGIELDPGAAETARARQCGAWEDSR